MRRPAFSMWLLALATGALLAATPSQASPAVAGDAPLRVVTSIAPLAMLASEVGGPHVVVQHLLPAGADAHTFEPRPSDVAALASADLVVVLGSELDAWVARVLDAGAKAPVLELDAAGSGGHAHGEETAHATGQAPGGVHDLTKSAGATDDDAHAPADAEEHSHEDPHVWLDPGWVRARAIPLLRDGLAAAQPQHAADFEQGAGDADAAAAALQADLEAVLAPVRGRAFLAWHPAWDRFAARFGLVALRGVGETSGREPSLKVMLAALRAAKQQHARALMVEPGTAPRLAGVVAAELGLPLATVDPMGDPSVADRSTYGALMRFNAHAFAAALGDPR